MATPGRLRPALMLRRLFPSHFVLVMATGIVSVDAALLGHRRIGLALFAVNVAAWLLLWGAGLARLAIEPRALLHSLARHRTGPAFLALVAGTAILGTQLPPLQLGQWAAAPLFALAAALWWGTIYGFFAGVSEGRLKPGLEHGFSGEWLLMVVATESLASLGADLLRHQAVPHPGFAFICYVLVLSGGVLYLFLGSLTIYRFAFVAMTPRDISGPWWISEGAAAITVLAGAKLMAVPGLMIGTFSLRALLAPIVVVFWADATFWIPLLVVLFAWKFLIRRQGLRYAHSLWAIVFPLGMFSADTLHLDNTYGLGFLHPVGRVFFWIAFVCWVATMAGALVAARRALFAPSR